MFVRSQQRKEEEREREEKNRQLAIADAKHKQVMAETLKNEKEALRQNAEKRRVAALEAEEAEKRRKQAQIARVADVRTNIERYNRDIETLTESANVTAKFDTTLDNDGLSKPRINWQFGENFDQELALDLQWEGIVAFRETLRKHGATIDIYRNTGSMEVEFERLFENKTKGADSPLSSPFDLGH